jgi:hypothetical protein
LRGEARGEEKMSTPYERIKALQQAERLSGNRLTIPDLLVLTPDKDPFYAGSEASMAAAEWFAGLFERFGGWGSHLRRMHYAVLSGGDVARPDGRPYRNEKKHWEYLQLGSRQARYLGKVDPEDLVDKRNPEPHIYQSPYYDSEPSFTHEVHTNGLDRFHPSLSAEPFFAPLLGTRTEIEGYEYANALQAYHVEVWAEKSTMNDVLIPLCRRLGVNFVSGAGYQSVTTMVKLLRSRVAVLEKPLRVLYVSDYDAAGRNMPKQMARHMEFWSERYGTDYDIRVEPIVMTAEQSADYPPAPDSGAVELDAMEVIHPGRLARIVQAAVAQFRDFGLPEKVREAEQQAGEVLQEAVDAALSEERAGIEEIKAEAEQIYSRYRPRAEELAVELNAELAPLDERLQALQQAAREKMEALEADLPEIPEGDPGDPEDEDWLFDSRREYLEQLDYYKRDNEDE